MSSSAKLELKAAAQFNPGKSLKLVPLEVRGNGTGSSLQFWMSA